MIAKAPSNYKIPSFNSISSSNSSNNSYDTWVRMQDSKTQPILSFCTSPVSQTKSLTYLLPEAIPQRPTLEVILDSSLLLFPHLPPDFWSYSLMTTTFYPLSTPGLSPPPCHCLNSHEYTAVSQLTILPPVPSPIFDILPKCSLQNLVWILWLFNSLKSLGYLLSIKVKVLNTTEKLFPWWLCHWILAQVYL